MHIVLYATTHCINSALSILMIIPHSKFKITITAASQNRNLESFQSNKKNRISVTRNTITGKTIFAIAAISILPVSTPILAMNHEINPERITIMIAPVLLGDGVGKSWNLL